MLRRPSTKLEERSRGVPDKMMMDRLLEATARAERDHFWFHGFRAFVGPLLAEAAGGRTSLMSLDCGCGTGNNLALLRTYGRVCGIDLTESGLRYAQAAGKTQLARATIASLPFADAQFDLVTSFDVLQCVRDEDESQSVAEMARVLRPGGQVVLTVSALDWLRGDHSVLSHEARRYTRARLRRLLEGAGFEVLRLTYTHATLVPVLLPVRYLERRRGLVVSDEDEVAVREIAVPLAPMNAVMKAILRAEAGLVRLIDLPVGSSLLCLARKPEGRRV